MGPSQRWSRRFRLPNISAADCRTSVSRAKREQAQGTLRGQVIAMDLWSYLTEPTGVRERALGWGCWQPTSHCLSGCNNAGVNKPYTSGHGVIRRWLGDSAARGRTTFLTRRDHPDLTVSRWASLQRKPIWWRGLRGYVQLGRVTLSSIFVDRNTVIAPPGTPLHLHPWPNRHGVTGVPFGCDKIIFAEHISTSWGSLPVGRI